MRTRPSSEKRGRPSRRKAISTTTSSKKAKSRARPTKRKTKSTDSGRARAGRVAYLALGSNRGNRRERLERALSEIAGIAPILGVSAFYRTEPVGFLAQPHFWNAVAAILWNGSPAQLLRATQRIEKTVGRTPSVRNGPREIDIDILDLGGRRRRGPDPVLPHPRLAQRRFVLAPLAELAPDWKHPDTGTTAAALLRALPERPRATRISSRPKDSAARRPGS